MSLRLVVAALAALTVLACGSAPIGGTPIPTPVTPPTGALAAWKAFPVNQVPRPVVLIGNAAPASGFSSSEAKIAALCRKFRLAVKLPTAVPVAAHVSRTTRVKATYPAMSAATAFAMMSRPDATTADPSCATAQPLVVNGAVFGSFVFSTDRGNARIAAWLFTAPGIIGEVAYPALAVSTYWNGGNFTGFFIGGSTLSADGRSLTLTFYGTSSTSGPCGADYKGVVAESEAAVAIALQETSHATPGQPVACDAMAQERSVTVTLAAPLGGRVVVDSTSSAVSVCPDTLTRAC